MVERKGTRSITLLEIATNIWSEDVAGMPIVYSVHKEFVRRGYTVHFLIPEDRQVCQEQHGVQVWRFWIPFYEPYPEKYGRGVWWIVSRVQWIMFFLFGTLKMVRLAVRLRPDVLYGHGTYGIPVAWLVGRLRRIPTISRTYGFALAQTYTRLQHLMNFELPLSLMLPADAYIIGDDGTYVRNLAERFGVRMSKAHFWLDGHSKDMYEEDFDKEGFKRALGIPASTKVVVTVSSLTKYKGIHYVVRAMPRVLQEVKDAFYVVVGDGPERQNLEELAKQLGVNHRIVFVGAVPHREIWKYLSIADVVPCLWSIGPIFEAMICKKCPIVLDILEMRRFISHGSTGILLDPKKIEHLDEVIIKLLRDDNLREEIGNRAQKWALKNLESVEERVNKEAELVERLARFHDES